MQTFVWNWRRPWWLSGNEWPWIICLPNWTIHRSELIPVTASASSKVTRRSSSKDRTVFPNYSVMFRLSNKSTTWNTQIIVSNLKKLTCPFYWRGRRCLSRFLDDRVFKCRCFNQNKIRDYSSKHSLPPCHLLPFPSSSGLCFSNIYKLETLHIAFSGLSLPSLFPTATRTLSSK